MNRAIDGDPPEGNTYDLVGHVQTSAALISINNRIDIIGVSNLHVTSWEWQVIVFLSRRNYKDSKQHPLRLNKSPPQHLSAIQVHHRSPPLPLCVRKPQ